MTWSVNNKSDVFLFSKIILLRATLSWVPLEPVRRESPTMGPENVRSVDRQIPAVPGSVHGLTGIASLFTPLPGDDDDEVIIDNKSGARQ